ncbi:AraC family transcriptional regulator [Dactylosporangium sp. NPDC049140]|uniref:AraC family transcriptional regulator n=1 Tax=Dactylosporangium sp. NPDC049140 TaxID=3155647 RepID=UPI0033C7013A
MDVLSDAVTAMRTGRPVAAAQSWAAPWGQRFAAVPGAVGLQVVVRGECWLIPDGDPIRLRAGDVVLLTDGRGHALADDPRTPLQPCEMPTNREISDSGGETLVLCAAYELTDLRTHPLLRTVPDLIHRTGSRAVRTLIELLAAELEDGGDAASIGVTALVDLLFLHTLRAWSAEHGEPAALTDPAVRAALDAIHAGPERPWTVAALAQLAGLSRAPFARRFAELTGQPPLAYVTWWRLTLAARLLRESDAPLRAVARRVGYASEFAFAAAFKRRFGTAPGRYRGAV